MKKSWGTILVTASFILGIVLTLLIVTAPGPERPAEASDFSVANQIAHIRNIARKPHPVGSVEHDRVRDYILAELREFGLEPQVQRTESQMRFRNGHRWAVVENVAARLAGRASTGAILLVAHYDSALEGPGANDNAAAVASILETLRAVRASSPLKNDVIALLTDGEEVGLLGAKAFVEGHAWMKDVRLVINLEARGSRGPSIIAETGPNNAWLMRAVASAAPHPVATSLAYAAYKRLPNDTDFSVFHKTGLAGLNLAYVEGWQTYHLPTDNVDHLNQRTLFHQGSTLLSLVRELGQRDLAENPAGDAIYFNPLPRILLVYPLSWGLPTAIAVSVLFLLVLVLGVRMKRLNIAGLLIGFGTAAGAAALQFFLSRLLLQALARFYGDPFQAVLRFSGFRNVHFIALLLLQTALVFAVLALVKTWAIPSISAGAMLWWLVLLAVLPFLVPEASYVVTWGLLFGLLGLGAVLHSEESGSLSFFRSIILALAVLGSLVVVLPIILMVLMVFSVAPMLFILTGLLLALLWPAAVVVRSRLWVLAGAALLAAVVVFALGLVLQRPGDFPLVNSLVHYWDADKDAVVEGVDFKLAGDESFEAQRKPLNDAIPVGGMSFYQRPGLRIPLPLPSLELLGSRREDGRRVLSLRAISTRREDPCILFLSSEDRIVAVEANGRALDERTWSKQRTATRLSPNQFHGLFFALPAEGITLRLTMDGDRSLKAICMGLSYKWPEGLPVPRLASPWTFLPMTMTSRSYVF